MNLILLDSQDFTSTASRTVRLNDRRFIHCRDVLRCQVGDQLSVGLIDGQIGQGKVLSIDESAIKMQVILDRPPPPPSNITLILALPRPKVMRRVLISAISMGVKELHLLNSWRVEKSFWKSPMLDPSRLHAVACEALEQARDTMLPHIHLHQRFKPFVEDLLPGIVAGMTALLAHPQSDDFLQPLSAKQPACLAVGPEGGFIPYEIEKLVAVGFQPVHIGHRILRVETAIPALLGRLQTPLQP